MLKDMTLCDEVFHTASGVAFADFSRLSKIPSAPSAASVIVGPSPAQNNIPRVSPVPFGTIAVELVHAQPRRCPVRPQTMLTVLTQRPPLLSGNWDESYWRGPSRPLWRSAAAVLSLRPRVVGSASPHLYATRCTRIPSGRRVPRIGPQGRQMSELSEEFHRETGLSGWQ